MEWLNETNKNRDSFRRTWCWYSALSRIIPWPSILLIIGVSASVTLLRLNSSLMDRHLWAPWDTTGFKNKNTVFYFMFFIDNWSAHASLGSSKERCEWFLSKVANIKTTSCVVLFFLFSLFFSFLLSSAFIWTFSCNKKTSSFRRPPFQKSLVDMYFNKNDRVQFLRQMKSTCTHRELVMCLSPPSLPGMRCVINACKIETLRNTPSFCLLSSKARWRYALIFTLEFKENAWSHDSTILTWQDHLKDFNRLRNK